MTGFWQMLEDKAGAIGVVLAVASGIWALLEYLRQQREKRAAQAAELEARFDDDPKLNFAVTLLDWGVGRLPVPPDYAGFLGGANMAHDIGVLRDAVRPGLTQATIESPAGTLYRLMFVNLFNHLERSLRLWRRGYVLAEDLPQTAWVIGQLCKWTYAGQDGTAAGGEPEKFFLPAMAAWYPDVVDGMALDELAKRFAQCGRRRRPRRRGG